MKSWWKKALALTVAWAVVVVGAGMLLANNAASQYAADKITIWIAPVFVVGAVVTWVAAFATGRGQ